MSTNIKKHKIKSFIKALQYQYCIYTNKTVNKLRNNKENSL